MRAYHRHLWLVGAIALALLHVPASSRAEDASRQPASTRVVEVRSYNLKPGTRDRFHALFLRDALPMLQRWTVDVIAYGPSLHDADSYYLMRGFPGVDQRQTSEDAFYGSNEWRNGPREAILADIINYTTIVIRLDADAIAGLRRLLPAFPPQGGTMTTTTTNTTASDMAMVAALNADYIRSVQTSNVARFKEILADDFLCSQPDGSLIDRARFLDVTARPVTISNLEAHDVNVRLMGDFAIVHARTTYTTADGKAGSGRYTDVWARRDGRWLAVSAHVTRN
jgi:ketosteroid isomerase-like protein